MPVFRPYSESFKTHCELPTAYGTVSARLRPRKLVKVVNYVFVCRFRFRLGELRTKNNEHETRWR
jgi:hypothetical protein